jgi:uncharacterized protein (DUF433 family)
VAKSGVALLERPLYTVGEAAQLLELPATTLRRWLDGYTRRGIDYTPVIRESPTGSDEVTWGEFVEAGYLREYRAKKVPLQQLRPFIDALRDKLGVPYPLAHSRPFVADKRLALDLQHELGLPASLYVVIERGKAGQLVLSGAAERFVDKVEFDPDSEVARALWPLGQDGLVEIRPDQSFGIPTVGGVRTEVVYEAFDAGEPLEAIASAWDLDPRAVQAALRWEMRYHKAA